MVFKILLYLVGLLLVLLFIKDVQTNARIKRIDKSLKTYIEHEQKSKEAEETAEAGYNDRGNESTNTPKRS
jgi:hypothetical protein